MMTSSFQISLWMALFFFFLCSLNHGADASCIHVINVTNTWGKIETPGFPSPFRADMRCSWHFTATPGYRVKIQFLQFDLSVQEEDGTCKYQWLLIINGNNKHTDENNSFKLCGNHSPGTVVTTDNVMQMSLYSTVAASGTDYVGFQASFVRTQGAPILPHLNVAKILEKEEMEKQKPAKKSPAKKHTLGSVLDRIRPSRGKVQLTQSQRIEEFNRRRNLGLPSAENPRFDAQGNVIAGAGDAAPARKTKIFSSTQSIQTLPPKKYRSNLSYEMKTVLIVLGIVSLCFVVVLVMVKLRLFKKMSQWNKASDEDLPATTLNNAQDNNCKNTIFLKENHFEKLPQTSVKKNQDLGSKNATAPKETNNHLTKPVTLQNIAPWETNKPRQKQNKHYDEPYCEKGSVTSRLKRTISKKAGVKTNPEQKNSYYSKTKERVPRKNNGKCRIESSHKFDNHLEKRQGKCCNNTIASKHRDNSANSRNKNKLSQRNRNEYRHSNTGIKRNQKYRSTHVRSYRNRGYSQSDSENRSSSHTESSSRKPPKHNKEGRTIKSKQRKKVVSKYRYSSSSVTSHTETNSSEDSTCSKSDYDFRHRPRRR